MECETNVIYKIFIVGKCRGDQPLNNTLDHFEKNKYLPEYLSYKKIDPNCKIGICKTNEFRLKMIDKINDTITGVEKYHKYLYVGLKVISNVNDKIIYRSKFYYIHNFNEYGQISVSLSQDGEPLKNSKGEVKYYNYRTKDRSGEVITFEPAYILTTYRYQGSKIDTKYNIYEVNKMDFNEFNTALGRATKLSD